jgi:sortase A
MMGKNLRIAERLLLAAGATLLTVYSAAMLVGFASSRLALWHLEELQPSSASSLPGDQDVNFSLWHKGRIQAYQETLRGWITSPLGVLRIDKLELQVPVFEGTGELVLNRGVGRIIGTSKLEETGNVGIAGHRDGFFRALKDIALGDRIELATSATNFTYEVDEIKVVAPDDVYVLQARSRPSVTLVTCYPFYFVGSAPQRFVVQASIVETNQSEAAKVASPQAALISVRRREK